MIPVSVNEFPLTLRIASVCILIPPAFGVLLPALLKACCRDFLLRYKHFAASGTMAAFCLSWFCFGWFNSFIRYRIMACRNSKFRIIPLVCYFHYRMSHTYLRAECNSWFLCTDTSHCSICIVDIEAHAIRNKFIAAIVNHLIRIICHFQFRYFRFHNLKSYVHFSGIISNTTTYN